MDYMAKNFRVPFKIRVGELPFFGEVNFFEISWVFRMTYPSVVDSIQMVIREEVLKLNAPRLLFTSQLLSIFLYNSMDFL